MGNSANPGNCSLMRLAESPGNIVKLVNMAGEDLGPDDKRLAGVVLFPQALPMG